MASFLKASSKALLSLGMLAASMQGAMGHIYLSSIFLGNEALPVGECVRGHPSTAYDSPIPLVNSADMTCGFLPYAGEATTKKCPIAAGSKMGLQWYHQSASPSDDIVDPTHQGPLMVYMVKTDSVLPTDGWFKVYEDGLTNGVWAVDKLIANRGRVDFTIPADIAPGNYLVRGEILALHGANALNGVQPYVGCVEVTVSGNGKATPAGVKIPGVYSQTDAGMLFDKYSEDFKAGKVAYPIPGPAVYKSGSTPSTGTSTPPAAATTRPTTGSSSTSAPATSAPATSAPATSAPSKPTTGNIKVGLTANSNTWYLEAIVANADQTTVKVEMMDSGSVRNWVALSDKGYGYVFSESVQITFPVSLRLTSSTGKQVVLTNIITSLSSSNVDTGKSYAGGSSSSTSAPATSAPATSAPATSKPATSAPVTSAPATSKPATSAPATSAPSTGNGKVTIHSGASAWWFALTVDADVSKVEIKDNGAYSTFTALKENAWGGPVVYSFSTSGSALTAPLTARITSKSGKVVTATISSITPDSVIQVGSL